MLEKADRKIDEIVHFFSVRGLEAGYLVPTETGLDKSIMDAHEQLAGFMRREGVHDYSLQLQGPDEKVFVKTWLVLVDQLKETKSSLYRPFKKSGDPWIWISGLTNYAVEGNLLALLVHNKELYVINTSNEVIWGSFSNPSSPFSHILDLLASDKNKPLEDRFSEWNLRLLRSFFSEATREEEVFLRADKSFLDQIGQDIGGDVGFLNAVRTGPAWDVTNNNFVQKVLALKHQRLNRSFSYKDPGEFDITYRDLAAPAYLPYLVALVRNYSENPTNYYVGLKKDLGLTNDFGSTEMANLEAAWKDLQNWTEETNRRFGYFTFRQLGGYRRIGVPRSQVIINPPDITALSQVFIGAGIAAGCDLTETDLDKIFSVAIASSAHFTAGFQQALNDDEFKSPILKSIKSAYSDWDGMPPYRKIDHNPNQLVRNNCEIDLSLVVTSQYPLCISPSWRIPAFADNGTFKIDYDKHSWHGEISGTESGRTNVSTSTDQAFWEILELVSRDNNLPLKFNAEYYGSSNSEPEKAHLTLEPHTLWILTPSIDPLTGRFELVESGLSASGPAYLLSPPTNANNLEHYLSANKPKHQRVEASGVPEGWLLVSLLDCSLLTQDQRSLPDGNESHPKPRAIRFVGGRSICRGYNRMYLPYDLPDIELDAPDGTSIKCSEGLDLTTIEVQPCNLPILKPLQRFKIKLANWSSAAYELEAVARDGSALGRAKLRISGIGGEIVEESRPFSLDRLGNPSGNSDGLSGVLLEPKFDEPEPIVAGYIGFNVHPNMLGDLASPDVLKDNVSVLFLDALADSGSLAYGVARNLLRRLLQSAHLDGEPIFIMLELRRRGHLEISTTYKGNIARIHSVVPTLYSLPSTSNSRPIWAIAGTLRISHWQNLSRETVAWEAKSVKNESLLLPLWRLVIPNKDCAVTACNQMGFRFVETPCIPIVDWLDRLDKFKAETFNNTIESIGSARENAFRFNVNEGLFTATPNPNAMTLELWKVKDHDTRIDNLYLLSNAGKYAFVRDSRWGVWLALVEFAKWVASSYGRAEVYPLPLTYQEANGTIWLPARLSPPVILERVLVLCSGSSPEVHRLIEYGSSKVDERVLLSTSTESKPCLSVNRFYYEMANGNWLSYRFVPRNVAEVVASKLEAALDTF